MVKAVYFELVDNELIN